MARKIRVEDAGFHHILNRSVNREVIFATDEDKEKFIEIVCEVSNHYDFTIHAYVIMSNHYHLLLENRRENLSHGMRAINASYAQYYNKKYKRTGHLWQDRFKSWFVFDENYLFTLFKYFEFNPIKAGITKKAGVYPYTLLHDILKDKLRVCTRDSFVLQWYQSTSELLKSVGITMSEDDFTRVEEFQKKAIAYKSNPKKIKANLDIKTYFKDDMTKQARNEAIMIAYHDGFTQSEIGRYLGLSCAGVGKIIKKLKV